MRASPEVSLDLDAEDLLAPTQPTTPVELEDIVRIDTQPKPPVNGELIELELTAEEMDAMLETGWHPRSTIKGT